MKKLTLCWLLNQFIANILSSECEKKKPWLCTKLSWRSPFQEVCIMVTKGKCSKCKSISLHSEAEKQNQNCVILLSFLAYLEALLSLKDHVVRLQHHPWLLYLLGIPEVLSGLALLIMKSACE